MNLRVIVMIIGIVLSMVHLAISTYCTNRYNPVCGNNGKTYTNLCLCSIAKDKNPKLVCSEGGECGVVKCSDDWVPVCGSDSDCVCGKAKKTNPNLNCSHNGEC